MKTDERIYELELTTEQKEMIEEVSSKDGCYEVIPKAAREGDRLYSLIFFDQPQAIAVVGPDAMVSWKTDFS